MLFCSHVHLLEDSFVRTSKGSRPPTIQYCSPRVFGPVAAMISTPKMVRDSRAFLHAVEAELDRMRTARIRNPRVWMDISVGCVAAGRLVFELRADVAPRTCENFRQLITGEAGLGNAGRPLHYEGSHIHAVIEGDGCMGGDLTGPWGGDSIYGETFADENFVLKHRRAGMLSMATVRPNENGTKFWITFVRAPWLDGRFVVFGELVEGFDTLEIVECMEDQDCRPRMPIVITRCGEQ